MLLLFFGCSLLSYIVSYKTITKKDKDYCANKSLSIEVLWKLSIKRLEIFFMYIEREKEVLFSLEFFNQKRIN